MLNRQKAFSRATWTVCFLAAEVALALSLVEGLAEPLVNAEEAGLTLAEGAGSFSIPAELGFVVDRLEASDPSSPLIVHLQEAHANPDAQRHLVEMLRLLIDRHGLQLILVEGGDGDVGLERLRAYATPEIRRQVLDRYLAAGIVSAEEYLDVTTDRALTLWGVEQRELYEQQAEAFLDAEGLQAAVQGPLDAVRRSVDELKDVVFDPDLIELEKASTAYDAAEVELGDYVATLSSLSSRQGVPLETFPHLARLIRLREVEQDLNVEAVSAEQTEVMSRLAGRMEPGELDALIERARQMKAGRLAKERYYADFAQIAESHGLELSRYPNLTGYMTYIEERSGLKTARVAEELPQLAQQLRASLTKDADSRQLLALADEVEVAQGGAQLHLTSEEARRFASIQTEDLSARWTRALGSLAQRHGLPARSFEGLDALQQALPAFKHFYDVARLRDEALISNAVAKLRASGQPLAALITGGFHSDRITQALQAEGFGVVVVAPRIDQPTDDRLYHAVLRYKEGLASQDEVFALANQ